MAHVIPRSVKALSTLRGPFATVYLDTSRTSEHGGDEISLRWREQRASLRAAGADDSTLAALDAVVGAHVEVGGARGQVAVASEGTVHLDRPLPAPPAHSRAVWAPLPHLVSYLARRDPAVAHVVVAADRAGADISAVAADDAADAAPAGFSENVAPRQGYPLHETARDTWDERHFQNRVQNAWADNARGVADEVGRVVAAVQAELVVLSGDSQARSLVNAALGHVLGPHVAVVEVDAGGRSPGGSPDAVADGVRDAVLRHSWRERREVLERLQANLGRGNYAVVGPAAVLAALRRAQVDTVVLSDDPSSTLHAWIGDEPTEVATSEQEIRDLGVAEPREDRFDAALLRAAAGSDARLLITPNAHDYVDGGIAALLRYDDDSTPHPA